MTKKEFKNIFDLRTALECLAIETAVHQIPDAELDSALAGYREAERRLLEHGDRTLLVQHDHTLHNLIIAHCDNPKLVEIMKDLHDLDVWARATLVSRRPDSYEKALPEHFSVMEALMARDAEAARAALREHLHNAFRRAYEDWNGNGVDGDPQGSSAQPEPETMESTHSWSAMDSGTAGGSPGTARKSVG